MKSVMNSSALFWVLLGGMILGAVGGALTSPPLAHAGAGGTLEDMSAAQVRAMEKGMDKIATQLDRINDTLREKCGR